MLGTAPAIIAARTAPVFAGWKTAPFAPALAATLTRAARGAVAAGPTSGWSTAITALGPITGFIAFEAVALG
jgi:hypothetical protein